MPGGALLNQSICMSLSACNPQIPYPEFTLCCQSVLILKLYCLSTSSSYDTWISYAADFLQVAVVARLTAIKHNWFASSSTFKREEAEYLIEDTVWLSLKYLNIENEMHCLLAGRGRRRQYS